MTTMTADDYPADFPDVEMALRELLAPIARTVTVLTDWSPAALPVIRVQRIGGGDTDEASDEAIVSLRCYAIPTQDNPRASQRLARAVRDELKRVNSEAPEWVSGTVIDRAEKQSGPVSTPFEEPSVRVTELIYRVTVRD